MNWLFQIADITKQAFHKKMNRPAVDYSTQVTTLIKQATAMRREHPRCGVGKLYDTINPPWIGRDNCKDLLYSYGFKLRKKVNYRRTTRSVSSEHQNLIEGMLVTGKNQVWQSDITYIKVGEKWFYLVFIIDVYTKQIVGYSTCWNMKAEANLHALAMAFKSQKGEKLEGLVHHSDRGSQYNDKRYLGQLQDRGIWISMAKSALENAYAERLNGIIKNEYLKGWTIKGLEDLKRKTTKAVRHYNSKRIHRHLPGKQSPDQFVKTYVNLKTQNRPKVIIYTDAKPKLKSAFSRLEFYPETEPQAPICPMVYS